MQLNLPKYEFKIRDSQSGRNEIFDVFRKKYVALTPEEWVRQNFLQFLIQEKSYPASLIAVEKGLVVNKMNRRFDAIAYKASGQPAILMEFKAPSVKLNQNVFEQIGAYNHALKVRYLIVSNGIGHYCCMMNYQSNEFVFLKEIPLYDELE